MKIDLVKVAELMNRRCNTRLKPENFEGKYMVDKDGNWDINDERETK